MVAGVIIESTSKKPVPPGPDHSARGIVIRYPAPLVDLASPVRDADFKKKRLDATLDSGPVPRGWGRFPDAGTPALPSRPDAPQKPARKAAAKRS